MSTPEQQQSIPNVDELALTIDIAQWQWLRSHNERGALITVSTDLDLAQVGHALATDAANRVNAWINAGKLGKPTAEEIITWNEQPEKLFRTLILSPYVLITAEG
ncbi:MAG TPA: DUF2288 domain-containing protein [Geobacterales bacterium]|nr:DUF2288 domain-containing protein [Geobacterales bacterium]